MMRLSLSFPNELKRTQLEAEPWLGQTEVGSERVVKGTPSALFDEERETRSSSRCSGPQFLGQKFARGMVSEQLRYPIERDRRQTWEERYDNHCSCANRAGVSVMV